MVIVFSRYIGTPIQIHDKLKKYIGGRKSLLFFFFFFSTTYSCGLGRGADSGNGNGHGGVHIMREQNNHCNHVGNHLILLG